MLRSMMQASAKGSAEAAQLHQKAFGARLVTEYRDDAGSYMHAELDAVGQILTLSESREEQSTTGNVMQFCLHLGEGDRQLVETAFAILEQDARILAPLGRVPSVHAP